MRILELLLLLADLALLLGLFYPWRRGPRWLNHVAVAAVLLALSHLIFEGTRWQMIPGYTLTALILMITLARLSRPSDTRRPRKLFVIAGGLTGFILWGVAVALPVLFPVFRFPAPSGPYGIGTVSYHWVDQTRPESLMDAPEGHRELMVQIWYPSDLSAGVEPAPYVPHPDKVAPVLAESLGLPAFVFGHLRRITTNAGLNSAVSSKQSRYPVLIFSHGGNGLRVQNTFQVEALVSHGYVVVGIDHTTAAAATVFPDGRLVSADPRWKEEDFIRENLEILAGDASFVLDQLSELNLDDPDGLLTGRLDMDRAGIFGHSLGGMVAAEACRLDDRIKAGIDMDSALLSDVVETGLGQPFMFISRDVAGMQQELAQLAPERRQALIDEQFETTEAVFNSLGSDGYFVTIAGLYHFNATDLPLWTPLATSIGFSGPIDVQRAHEIINAYSLAFFDKHLSGRSDPLLDNGSPAYPEVELKRHQTNE